jgi:hypothetical protein
MVRSYFRHGPTEVRQPFPAHALLTRSSGFWARLQRIFQLGFRWEIRICTRTGGRARLGCEKGEHGALPTAPPRQDSELDALSRLLCGTRAGIVRKSPPSCVPRNQTLSRSDILTGQSACGALPQVRDHDAQWAQKGGHGSRFRSRRFAAGFRFTRHRFDHLGCCCRSWFI